MIDFAELPPEVNSGRMYSGPGSRSLMIAATAWNTLAGQLESVSRDYEAVVLGLQGEVWSGATSEAMAAAAAPYVAWLAATGAHAGQVASRARTAASAYETALAVIVPPTVVAANRVQLMNLIANNILGQNATAIAATEADYAEMWAQDAHAMYGYAASSSAATQLTPFSQPPETTNPAGQSGQAAAVHQAAGSSAVSQSQSTLSRLMSLVPQQLQSLASGTSAGSTAASPATVSAAADPSVLDAFGAFNTVTNPVNFGDGISRTITSGGSFGSGLYRIGLQEASATPPALSPAVPQLPSQVLSSVERGPVLAAVGQAAPIGGLSAPPAWASATPVASVSEDPYWLSEMEFAATASPEGAVASAAEAAPMAGLGPMAGMAAGAAARSTVSSMLRVQPRRFKMPRPSLGG
ncbi:PPE family protein [Mycobacterium sp. SVM_VP21]|nr:PPE family protein [Mycobacterium sp. SVM_VP21]